MIDRIQIALRDRRFAERLRELLLRTCTLQVSCVDRPAPDPRSVVVVHADLLDDVPPANPAAIVVVSKGDEESLARARNLGVTTVVQETDPMPTIVLAVMAAWLNARHYWFRPVSPSTVGHAAIPRALHGAA